MYNKLGDLFANLSYGPLAGLSIGMDGTGLIEVNAEGRLVHFTNQGLTRLYSRFLVLERELTIRCIDGKTLYPLFRKYSDNYTPLPGEVPAQRFIVDSPAAPFMADSIRVLRAWDKDFNPVPVNDEGAETSVFTPSKDTIQIPGAVAGDLYHFTYQARHPQICTGNLDQSIYLPEPLWEALEAFIGWKIYASMNGDEHRASSRDHKENYENICANAEERDLVKTSLVQTNSKLEERGFK